MHEFTSQSDRHAIIRALIEGESLTPIALHKALEWASNTRRDEALLAHIVKGDMKLSLRDDGELLFALTEQGKVHVEALLEGDGPDSTRAREFLAGLDVNSPTKSVH